MEKVSHVRKASKAVQVCVFQVEEITVVAMGLGLRENSQKLRQKYNAGATVVSIVSKKTAKNLALKELRMETTVVSIELLYLNPGSCDKQVKNCSWQTKGNYCYDLISTIQYPFLKADLFVQLNDKGSNFRFSRN